MVRRSDGAVLLVDQRIVTVPIADVLLLGPNTRRRGAVFGCPPGVTGGPFPIDDRLHNADTSTTGVKLSQACPPLSYVIIDQAGAFATAGAPTLDLELFDGASAVRLATTTTGILVPGPIVVPAGSTIRWNCRTAVGASTADLTIQGRFVQPPVVSNRVDLSLRTPAVAGQGIGLMPGNAPLVLTHERLGHALEEEVHAVATNFQQAICVWDIFEA